MHPRRDPNAIPLWGKWLIAILLGAIATALLLSSIEMEQAISAAEAIYTLVFSLAIIAIIGGFYVLPAFIAHGTPRFAAILVLNLAFGWTLIGWIAALIWSLAEVGTLNKKSVP